MRKKYESFDRQELKREYRRLNRKLILPNIIIAAICIIAVYFQMLTPFLKLSVHITGDAVATLISTYVTDENLEGSGDSTEDALLDALSDPELIASAAEDVNVKINVQLYPMQLLNVATASDDAIRDEIITLVAEVVTDINVKDTIEELLQQVVPQVAGTAIAEYIKSNADELTEEQQQIIEDCADSITKSLNMLADGDTEGARENLLSSVEDAMREAGYSEEDISSVSKQIAQYFDDLVECSTDADGNFSYLTMLENIDELMEKLGSSSEESGEAGATAAISCSLTADSTANADNGETETTSAVSEFLELLDDPEALAEKLLGDSLDDENLSTLRAAVLGLFAAIVFVSAAWALLALFALLHILLKNKKVGMWYVKLFGGLAAVVCYLLPNVALLALKYSPALVAELGDTAALLVGMLSFGGSGLAVLICLLALWLVSIFWCHPIKKKIKRCKREIKRA